MYFRDSFIESVMLDADMHVYFLACPTQIFGYVLGTRKNYDISMVY